MCRCPRPVWSYDPKTGTLFCGAKMVAILFNEGRHEAFAGTPEEAHEYGHKLARRMNEENTRKRNSLRRWY